MTEIEQFNDLTQTEREILSLMMNGQNLTRACKQAGVNRNTFYGQMAKRPSLSSAYALAQKAQLEGLVDSLQTIHDDVPDVQKAKLASDNIKWLAAKIEPSKYSDRIDINVTNTVDLVSAISQARDRMRSVCDQQTEPIDLTPDKSGTYTISTTDNKSDEPKMPDIFG